MDEVVGLVGEVLGPEVIGAYLHGSAVLGGLKPASDIDVLVVTRRSMDEGQRAALWDGLLGISGFPPEARPVELTVVVQSEVRPWRYPPVGDLLFGEWLRGGPVPGAEVMPDLALLIPMVLAGDHVLVGPGPREVLDPVPHADLVRASVAGVPDLLGELDDDTRNVVLTLARIWSTVVTGEIRPKDAAADWALERLPRERRPVLEYARDLYLNARYADEDWAALRSQVRAFAEYVVSEVDRRRSRTGGTGS